MEGPVSRRAPRCSRFPVVGHLRARRVPRRLVLVGERAAAGRQWLLHAMLVRTAGCVDTALSRTGCPLCGGRLPRRVRAGPPVRWLWLHVAGGSIAGDRARLRAPLEVQHRFGLCGLRRHRRGHRRWGPRDNPSEVRRGATRDRPTAVDDARAGSAGRDHNRQHDAGLWRPDGGRRRLEEVDRARLGGEWSRDEPGDARLDWPRRRDGTRSLGRAQQWFLLAQRPERLLHLGRTVVGARWRLPALLVLGWIWLQHLEHSLDGDLLRRGWLLHEAGALPGAHGHYAHHRPGCAPGIFSGLPVRSAQGLRDQGV
mmetsp:Transcript_3581/g.10479  ORF Transcript_3581/g.10479 Transcript_3581/m.10479 type:complete len:312 (-) Transcript_3581:270-1205(-)